MRSNAHKLICSIVITTIVNSSFQPLYAVTFNQPKTSEDLSIEVHPRPSLLALDDFLQEKAVMSAHLVQAWTPDFIKSPLSSAYEGVCSWFGSKVKEIAPSILAKNPFEIDYAHDLNYWQAHFAGEIEELKNAEFNPERLVELQNIVWSGLLSPYQYEQGLKELKGYLSKSQLKKISKRFKAELKSVPELLRQNVRRDLVASLGDIHDDGKGIEAFKELLDYYQSAQNALDNTENLVEFTRFIQKNREALKLDTQQYRTINKAIANVINQRDAEQYRELRKQRQLTQSALQELSYYSGDVFEDIFNSALPLAIKEDNSKGSWLPLKGLTRLAYKGLEYAVEHPIQAITLGLASQVAAAAALNILKTPEVKDRTLDNDPEGQAGPGEKALSQEKSVPEQSSSFLSPRYSKRALGEDFQINQNTTSDQAYSSVACLMDGNAFVVWQGNKTGDYDAYGRLFSANGTTLGNEFIINQNISFIQGNPFVASLTNGNAFVVWHGNQAGVNSDVYGRLFSANGTALDNEFIINQNITSNQANPSVASLTNGNAFVAWEGSQAGNFDVYGRLFSANGTALSNEFGINQNTTNNQLYPFLTSLLDGNVFVIWLGYQTGDPDIYGRILSVNGTALSNDFTINQNRTGSQRGYSSIATLSNGNIFLAWGGDQTGNADIYGRIFSANGTALNDEFGINQNITNDQYFPSISTLTNHNVFVTWYGNQTGNYNIYGRVFSENGTALSNEFGINQITTGDRYFPSVAGLLDGNAFVAWQDNRRGNYNIYGSILSSEIPGITSTTGSFTTSLLTSGLSSTTGSLTTDSPATTNQGATSSSTTSGLTTTLATTNPFTSADLTTSPLSTTFLSDSLSSSPLSSDVPIIIGATVGGITLIGGGCGLVYCLYKKRPKHLSLQPEPGDANVELPDRTSKRNRFITAIDIGYTHHPHQMVEGVIRNKTYGIWKEIFSDEAALIQPHIAKKIPSFDSLDSLSKPLPFNLGTGNFGATYVGSEGGTLYAIKEVHGKKAVEESRREGELQDELKNCLYIMSLVDYLAYSTLDGDPRLFQIMPLAYTNGMGYKQMTSLLKEKDPTLHEKLAADNFLQLMKGLAFMHGKSIVHLDIKDENILYMLDGTLRIGDLGRARKLEKSDRIADNKLGDRRKFSPEIIAFVRFLLKQLGKEVEVGEIANSFSAKAADTWAAGLYILELWLNDDPLSDSIVPYGTKVRSWTNASFEKVLEGIKPLREAASESFPEVLRQVLTVDVNKRLEPSKAVKKLKPFNISSEERKEAFKNLIKLMVSSQQKPKASEVPSPLKVEMYGNSREKDENYKYTISIPIPPSEENYEKTPLTHNDKTEGEEK